MHVGPRGRRRALARHVSVAVAALTAVAGLGALSVVGAPAAFAGTTSFEFTGGLQSFTVPAGVTSVTVVAEGAQGGGTVGAGGRGASIGGEFAVTPGESLAVVVGGSGGNGQYGGMGGGGGSFVWRGAGFADLSETSLLVAAGGGGGGGSGVNGCSAGGADASVGGDGTAGVPGGAGGTGGAGGALGPSTGSERGGGGGGILGGGGSSGAAGGGSAIVAGGGGGSPLVSGGSGGFGGGGAGHWGSGGGGGFSGGGGGGSASTICGGGGGGGSFNAGTSQVNNANVGVGNGHVTIEFVDPPSTALAASSAFRLNPSYRATLTTSNGSPLAGRTVVFRVSGVHVCSAVTNGSGVATCRTFGLVLGPSSYTASFAGDASYLPSTSTGTFTP